MYNRQLRQVVATLTDEQLAIRPSPDRWPIWASIGHLLCQRVCWLCNFAGEPGAEATPFPDALYRCPGDEYLEPAMDSGELVEAIDSTFRIVETVLDSWTIEVERGDSPDMGSPGNALYPGIGHPAGLRPRHLSFGRAK